MVLPVYEILTNETLRGEISTRDLERVEQVLRHVTKIMLGVEINLDLVQQKYFFDGGGFMRQKVTPLKISEKMKRGEFYKLLTAAENVCFTVRQKIPAAKFIFIAPWTSTDGDKISALPFNEKIELNNAYSAALGNWCAAQGETFINANPYIDARLKNFPHKDYLIDFIHPNAGKGVELYAEALLSAK